MENQDDNQRLLEEQPVLERQKGRKNLPLLVFAVIVSLVGVFAFIQMFAMDEGNDKVQNSNNNHKQSGMPFGGKSPASEAISPVIATTVAPSPSSITEVSDKNTVSDTLPETPISTKKQMTVQQIRDMHGQGSLSSTYKWVTVKDEKDGYYVDVELGVYMLNHIEDGTKKPLAYRSDIKQADGTELYFHDWQISPDLKTILLSTNKVNGWRHSFFADYWVFDIETKTLKTLNTTETDKFIPHEKGSGKTSLVIWGPNSHAIAWVRDNDLHVTIDRKEFRITNDGSKDIINGIADWVYEEEVLAAQQATWFSLDSTCIAFIKFNESLVTDYELQYYAKYGETPYPTKINVKYPKPGTANPTVGFYISKLNSSDHTPVLIDFGKDGFAEDDILITQVTWVSQNDAILVRLMNRVQDIQKLFLVTSSDPNSNIWRAELVREEKTPDEAWFNVLQPLYLLDPQQSKKMSEPAYIELMDSPEGFQHLAYFSSVHQSSPSHWITKGNWEVAEIKGIDVNEELVFYMSTEIGTSQRHLYSIGFDGKGKKLLTPAKPYTKVVPQAAGSLGSDDSAGFYNAQFSKGCKYYVLAYLGPDIPWERIEKVDESNFGSFLAPVSQAKVNLYTEFETPSFNYFKIKNTNGDLMDAKMILPANFDASRKYPVLMHVYGGPGSQMTSMVFTIDFMHKITSQNVISVLVDGRGTGFHGRAYRSAVSKHLGSVEIEDQITAAKWLSEQSYVDKTKIGIWGWSFGGYLTCKAIEADSGVISLGMAVAPVTDWKFYDTAYTERFMKTPQMNPAGYRESAVRNMEGFRHTKFLMIHGTADGKFQTNVDNVHFQNSAELVWHLTGAGVEDYTTQYYTDSDHSIYNNGANPAVYHKLERFMCKNWDLKCAPL